MDLLLKILCGIVACSLFSITSFGAFRGFSILLGGREKAYRVSILLLIIYTICLLALSFFVNEDFSSLIIIVAVVQILPTLMLLNKANVS